MKPRILVVEDTAAMLDNLAQIFDDAGYDALTAANTAAALEMAKSGFDVALVDLRLPDGGGLELCGLLKEAYSTVEVVLLTGYATLESAAAAVRVGAFAYLVKPCPTEDLLATVKEALERVRSREEKRDSQRRAQMAEKIAVVGQMTAGLSHEIRNPLNAASLQLLLLERLVARINGDVQAELSPPLKLAREEMRRLSAVFDDFLQFARPRDLTMEPVDLSILAEGVIRFLSAEAERHNVVLEKRLEPVLARCDSDAIRLALSNLVLNGIDAAAPNKGQVRISTRPDGKSALVCVEDAGPGIPASARPRIFEPFFTTKPNGTGLGLPIAHAIATQHSGSIGVEPSALGGACFWVRLPSA